MNVILLRQARIERNTSETQIRIFLNLDGNGNTDLKINIPFFIHMLEQVAHHGLLDLELEAHGDLDIDAHHTIEDLGIVMGQALYQALGEKKGIRRYGHAYVPLDEALSRVVIDLSGRSGLIYQVNFTREYIGTFEVELIREFFQSLVNHARLTLHIDNLRGENAHHQAESVFKAFGRALRMAVEPDLRMVGQTPSTKGTLL